MDHGMDFLFVAFGWHGGPRRRIPPCLPPEVFLRFCLRIIVLHFISDYGLACLELWCNAICVILWAVAPSLVAMSAWRPRRALH